MKVLVCGGRHYCDMKFLYHVLDIFANSIDVIISGCAPGADSLALGWANKNNKSKKLFHPDWKQYGKKAGPIRNQKMLDEGNPDVVIAFPGGNGTKHMIKISKNANVPVLDFNDSETYDLYRKEFDYAQSKQLSGTSS